MSASFDLVSIASSERGRLERLEQLFVRVGGREALVLHRERTRRREMREGRWYDDRSRRGSENQETLMVAGLAASQNLKT